MSSPEFDFRDFLLTQPAVAAALGNRLHPGEVPQNSPFPAARFIVIDVESMSSFSGPNGLRRTYMQIDVYHPSARTAAGVRDVLIAAGEAAVDPARGIQGAFTRGGRLGYDPSTDGAGPRIYAASVDFEIYTTGV